MPVRIVDRSDDRAKGLPGVTFGAAMLALGFFAGRKVFDPAAVSGVQIAGALPDEHTSRDDSPTHAEAATGAAPDAAAAQPSAVVALPMVARLVVQRAVVQSCGDGEELTTPGEQCERVAGLAERLRNRVLELGRCPAAELASRSARGTTLSLGLRVDFARRRVTPLPGHSSTVPNAVAFVPCARTLFDGATDLWSLQPSHRRYLVYVIASVEPVPVAHATPFRPASPVESSRTSPVTSPNATVAAAVGSAVSPTRPAATPVASQPTVTSTGQLATMTVVQNHVRVRHEPNHGTVLGLLSRGSNVQVFSRRGRWYEIAFSGGRGWVYRRALRP